MDFKIDNLSSVYTIKKLKEQDIEKIYNLCKQNNTYYKYLQIQPSFDNIKEIFTSLPPNKTIKDKFFIGFYKDDKIIAILDLIINYPNKNSAYIGLFMTDKNIQNKGIGTKIIEQLCYALKQQGFYNVELAYIKDNIEAKNFWLKNKFLHNGKSSKLDTYTVLCMYREL